MKLFQMIVFLILFSVGSINANKITRYEYWVDSDFSNRVSMEIDGATDEYELRDTIDFEDLQSGIHSFHVRFKDSTGKWSVAQSSLFYKPIQGKPYPDKSYPSNKIYAYEYWIDTDFANRVSGEALPLDDIYLLRGEMNLENLQSGIHSFHVRFKDSTGKWSVAQSSLFYKPIPSKPYQDKSYQSNKIYGYRWWFDNNINTMFEIELKYPIEKFTTSLNIQCPELETIGDHYINIQFLDSAGKLSIAQTDTFFFEGFVMPKPELYSPTHISYVKKDSILEWDVVPYSTKYQMQIASDTAFANIVVNIDSTTINTYQLDLTIGTKYFWRVRAYYSETVSDWSEIWKFTTIGYPTIDTIKLINYSSSFINAESDVISNGGEALTGKGICWNTTGNPTIADSKTNEGSGIGIFQTKATGLTKDTKYYIRGYATNSIGTVYTNEVEVTTPDVDDFDVNLITGWNMISTYVEPEDISLESIFADINDNIVIVKNNAGQIYFPMFEINDIEDWDITQGYQVYMADSETLTITGTQVEPESTQISLDAGWNMIAYLRNSAMDIEIALASLTDDDNLVIAKDNFGNVYFPAFEINMIGDMLPGQGYQIYIIDSDSFSYPEN